MCPGRSRCAELRYQSVLELPKCAAQAPRVSSASARCEKHNEGLQEVWCHLRVERAGLSVIAAIHDRETVGRQCMLELVWT